MNSRHLASLSFILILVLVSGCCCCRAPDNNKPAMPTPSYAPSPVPSTGHIIIGVEYAMPGVADEFSAIGVPAVKRYPGDIAWVKMQPTMSDGIDFKPMDDYVREYQGAGFTELVVAFKTEGSPAVKGKNNYCPNPAYMDEYVTWIRSVVERYDHDGVDDMPGLKYPVIYYEVGTEFSTYEPEPVDEYIGMLEQAYRAAHNASGDVIVMNAAFLTTTAFKDDPGPGEYEAAFAAVDKRIMYHSLADIRTILDRPDIFDAVDIHSIGDPYEIESIVEWLNYEMSRRGYSKPIVIGDTAASPFIAWGPATISDAPASMMGIVVPPAEESDRVRLAGYFKKLVAGDADTVDWTRKFTAQDVVKKVVVAAEQNVTLINTAFMEDLTLLQSPIFMAGAGISPWSGMTSTNVNVFTQKRTVTGYYPSFYALKQLNEMISGYDSVIKVDTGDANVYVYRFGMSDKTVYVAWMEPKMLIIPEEAAPVASMRIHVDGGQARITRIDYTGNETFSEITIDGNDSIELTMSQEPAYVIVTG